MKSKTRVWFDAMKNDVAIETLEIAHEGLVKA